MSAGPEFLDVDDVIHIHADQVAAFGGSSAVRDRGLLESAVAMPSAAFEGTFLHDGLFAMAAAYLFHLVKNHPFVDGNKRAALAASLIFLELNGWTLRDDDRIDDELYDLTIAAATGGMDKSALAGRLEALHRAIR